MYSLEGIRNQSRLAARKTAQETLRPYIVEADDLADFHLTIRAGVVPTFPFPFIGSYQPPGFIETGNRYFVDSSGSGAVATRPLLAFVKKLREGYAYAVIEADQCQWCVQEYEASTANGPSLEEPISPTHLEYATTVPRQSVTGFLGRSIAVGATVIYAAYGSASLRQAKVVGLRERYGRVESVVKHQNQRGTVSLLHYPNRVLVWRRGKNRQYEKGESR